MSVYRYINNSEKDIISGAYLVPANDQLMFNEAQPVLDALVGKTLVGLINGVLVEDSAEVTAEPKPVIVAPKEPAKAE